MARMIAGLALAAAMATAASGARAQESDDPKIVVTHPFANGPDEGADDDGEGQADEGPVFRSQWDEVADELAATMPDISGPFAGLFDIEPLTAEQEARLPAARVVVDHILAEGSFARMMNTTMAPMMKRMMAMQMPGAAASLARMTGIDAGEIAGLDPETTERALAILDPARDERMERLSETMIDLTGQMLARMEPAYRDGLAQAYAVHFSRADLDGLAQFFATPLGARYAGRALVITADPRVLSAMNSLGPAMQTIMPDMIRRIGEVARDVPEARDFAQLSGAEKTALARLLGRSESELEALAPASDDDERGSDDGDFPTS